MKRRVVRKGSEKSQEKEEHLSWKKELTSALPKRETHIEISGSREAVVEGSRGIVEYDETGIRLNVAEGQLVLSGRNLQIVGMAEDSIIIRGYIMGLNFSN